MKLFKSNRLRFLGLLAVMLGLTGSAYAAFYTITPPKALLPSLKTYSQSAVDYQKWLFASDLQVSEDTTGASCKLNQPLLGTWYLAGNEFIETPVTRSCTIPLGRTLLIPVTSIAVCASPDDQPQFRTPEFVHDFANSKLGAVSSLTLTIDGVPVNNLLSYYENSPIFSLGPQDNPCADAGYYVAVSNLLPGNHTIHWTANTDDTLTVRDVTYNIKISLLPF
jgi:hypothetical protein